MFDLTANSTLMTSLTCATLNPGLRNILVLDAPHAGLQQLANILTELLQAISDQPVRQYQLSAFESDDDVWGRLSIPWSRTGHGETPTHRLFSAERNTQEWQLITIPDLTALSLVAARSVTVLVGAEVVHLERNGLSACWRPQQFWLANCRSDAVGKLSPHMLDRFSLRLSWQEIAPLDGDDDETAIANLLAHVPHEPLQAQTTLPSAFLQSAKQAMARQVKLSRTALAHVLNYLPTENYYPRREIALVRFALALAQLSGDPTLASEHIDRAAQILGFPKRRGQPKHSPQIEDVPLPPDDDGEEEPGLPVPMPTTPTTELLQEMMQPRTARIPETIHTNFIDSGTICSQPYPEDQAPLEREEAALKLPPQHYSPSRSARGTIIGTQECDTFYDLALVSTILAALRCQKMRQQYYLLKHQQTFPGLLIERMDLRRYRRSQPCEQLLLLLLDYTCIRENSNWEATLIPYLHAAYIARAAVTIIKVGAKDAIQPLRAAVVSAKNILVPRIGLALEASAGQATPLAHGLSLALEQLQRVLQHGRNTAHLVTFVVISDGRGNVPLAASLRGGSDRIITREGIDDALREAHKIRSLKQVETFVLNPQPEYYPDLPERLSEALGATLVPIPVPGKAPEVVS